MIAHSFPDFSLRDHNFDAPCEEVGWPNMLLRSCTSCLEWPDHSAPLSLAVVTSGRALFRFGRRTIPLDDGFHMIIDEGDRFECTIDGAQPVESFHIFLQAEFAARVQATAMTTSDRLLDNETPGSESLMRFEQKLHRHNPGLTPLLAEIVRVMSADTATAGWHDEIFHRTATHLLETHSSLARRIAQLPALRSATRNEIMRRLHLAVDLIHSAYHTPLTLASMASAALMSPYHFLRAFRTAFGRTPHQYLTTLRLEQARTLLTTSEIGIAEIGRRVGIDSPSSFTTLFRQHTGIAPSAFRAARNTTVSPVSRSTRFARIHK